MEDAKKTIAVGLEIKTGDTEKNLKGVEKGLSDVDKGVKKVNDTPMTLDKKLENLKKEIDGGGLSMRELSRKVQEFQTIALEAGRTSPIGQAALKEAAGLTDRLTDLRNEVKRMASDGAMMQGALQLGSSVTAGYGALQGVMALAGQENEQLMKSLVKMQAAQSVLTGIEQIRLALEKESVMMTGLRTAQTKIATGVQLAYATVVGTSTGALKLFKIALAATGIGAIIVGLGLLIANFDKVSESVSNASKKILNLRDSFKEMGAGMKVLIGILSFGLVPAVSFLIDQLEALGVVDDENTKKLKENNEKKIKGVREEAEAFIKAKKREIKAIDDRYNSETSAMEHQLNLARANGKETVKLERALLEERKKVTAQKIELLEEIVRKEFESSMAIMKIQAQTNDFAKGMLSAMEKAVKDAGGQEAFITQMIGGDKELIKLKETLNTTEKELEVFDAKVNKAKRDKATATSKALQDELDKQIEAERIANEKKFQLLQKAILDEEKVYEDFRKRQLDEEQKKLDALNERYEMEIALLQEDDELRLKLKEEFESEKLRIETEYAKKRADETERLNQEAKDKQKQEDDEELARKLALIDQVNGYAQDGLSFLSNLNSAFSKDNEKAARRDFALNKAAALSGAIADGAAGVLKTASALPFPTNIPTTVAAGVFATGSIAKIASSKFQSSGGGASSSISVPRVTNSSAQAQANQQNDVTTNVADLLNKQQPPVLVVDSFNKVDSEQSKIKTIGTIG
jgi:hypothetical protein